VQNRLDIRNIRLVDQADDVPFNLPVAKRDQDSRAYAYSTTHLLIDRIMKRPVHPSSAHTDYDLGVLRHSAHSPEIIIPDETETAGAREPRMTQKCVERNLVAGAGLKLKMQVSEV
jgi:hypothetical protein